ncbi:MAG: helix-turn-helix transcriptional regulator [Solobacterium sp.]|nr:helix-turn-helix transcriptional regulator [Solobacterium sp.]
MEIGSIIRNARNNAKLSQEQAAETLGVSRQTISNWETGVISQLKKLM